MPRLRQVLTLDEGELESLSKALDSRRAGEPVVRELRASLSRPIPSWATKLTTTVELDSERVAELRGALTARARLLEQLPEGGKRNALLATTAEAQRVVDEVAEAMHGTMSS